LAGRRLPIERGSPQHRRPVCSYRLEEDATAFGIDRENRDGMTAHDPPALVGEPIDRPQFTGPRGERTRAFADQTKHDAPVTRELREESLPFLR